MKSLRRRPVPSPSKAPDLRGMRVVAAFEAVKGVLATLVGIAALSLIHKDMQQIAETLVGRLHLDLNALYPRIFIDAAARLSDSSLWLLAALAFGYAALRSVEAWGLWRARHWAQWLAVAVGGIYLPVEIYELFHGLSAVKAATLTANVGIVLYMANSLWRSRRKRAAGASPEGAAARR